MQHLEDFFTNTAGARIAYQCWLPDTTGQAIHGIIVISHGLAEHGGRYQEVAEYFVAQSYGVYAIDHIGHGKSDGRRCFVNSMNDYVDTLHELVVMVTAQYSDQPIYLLGHSMGGLIASLYLLEHQQALAGAILSAPLISRP